MFLPFFVMLAFLSLISVRAAVPGYGQCGGSGYYGDAQCASGYTCTYVSYCKFLMVNVLFKESDPLSLVAYSQVKLLSDITFRLLTMSVVFTCDQYLQCAHE